MTAEQVLDEQFNSDYIEALLARASEPYVELAAHAGQLGLHDYVSQLEVDAKKAGNVAGTAYLNRLGSGLIDDQSFARELAVTQDHYESAKKQITGLDMQDSIKTETLAQLNIQLEAAHRDQIHQYKIHGRRFIDFSITEKLPSVLNAPLEALTDEEIEERYNTAPINRADFDLTGFSPQVGGRAWNAFTHKFQDRVKVGEDEGELPDIGPQVHFLKLREKTAVHDFISDRYQDLTFSSFYNMIRWVDERVTKEGLKVSTLMGNGAGEQTLSVCKQLIAVRAKQTHAE